MSSINLLEIHDNLLEIAFEAGRMITSANTNAIQTGTKINCAPLNHAPTNHRS